MMAIDDIPLPRELDLAAERAARAHERSAARFEAHAALLDRYGAHRFANTERRHAQDERDAAEAFRRRAGRRVRGRRPSGD
jgi:hypothetical protein